MSSLDSPDSPGPEEYGDVPVEEVPYLFCPGGGVSFSNFGACSEGALGAFASDRLVTHVIVGPCDNQRL